MNPLWAISRPLKGTVTLALALVSPWAVAAQSPSAGIAASNSVSLRYESRHGHVLIPTFVNGSGPLSFMLDTGYGTTLIGPNLAQSLGLRRTGRTTIVGIAGEEEAGVFEGPKFEFSGAQWTPRRVTAFPDGDEGGQRRRDGILGSGFFRRFVVEIDPSNRQVKLSNPEGYEYHGPGEALPLKFKSTTPIVEAMLRLNDRDGTEVTAGFEIDTGCSGGLCLGNHFVIAHQLARADAQADGQRYGVGGGTRTRSGQLRQLRLGNLTVNKPAADFFLDGSPVDAPLAGHIGWDVLRQFRVIFDYQRKRMILEPKR